MAAALPIRVFAPRESYRYAKQAAFGSDSSYLAQETRPRLLDWQRGKTVVVAAMAGDGTPACWAAFGPLAADGNCWQYGNLFTKPEHRRQGLAQAVVTQGLEVARLAGARHVLCLIATGNGASESFHRQLGFRATSVRTTRLRVATDSARQFEGPSLRAHELQRRIIGELPLRGIAKADAALSYILDHLLPDRPLLPWRRPAAIATWMRLDSGASLYIRFGQDSVNALAAYQPQCALTASARAAEIMAALRSLGRASCGVFHDEELAAALAPHASHAFTVSAFETG